MADAWLDGLPASTVPLANRGLAYGDGLFETIKVKNGKPSLLARHLARLQEGCKRLSLNLNIALLRQELAGFCENLGDGVAKLIITRGDGQRGYAPSNATPARRILMGSAMPAYPPQNAQAGVRLFPCQTRLACQPLLAGLKHLNRLEQVLARGEWQSTEYAEGLLCDYSGRVIEGVFSNLFVVKDGHLLTADLSRCGVAGVMRALLLELAGNANIPLGIRDISYRELLAADEVFICNSLYGIWPVIALRAKSWPIGAVTRTLQDLLNSTEG
ncbi:4-amino-4-deoxychorismate lyase [Ventosimonas gracilis]|uniref:Aminodeoxychorismate lyase n=1 Tax=Ventosimonas gracilis TaxID=1680762 RepID=A0A139SNZ2_9GAMM|nr:aminodeoxychorismate lyase [Ventosimonas gracilis]KXU36319.1 4-amino-4-deoxychorismate lyase [Ventosimonas gracilis]